MSCTLSQSKFELAKIPVELTIVSGAHKWEIMHFAEVYRVSHIMDLVTCNSRSCELFCSSYNAKCCPSV